MGALMAGSIGIFLASRGTSFQQFGVGQLAASICVLVSIMYSKSFGRPWRDGLIIGAKRARLVIRRELAAAGNRYCNGSRIPLMTSGKMS